MAHFLRTAGFTLVLSVASTLASEQGDPLRRQAYLGVSLRPPAIEKAGAEVRQVTEGAAAARAGLQVGDRILKINGRVLDSPVTFEQVYQPLRGGDTVRFEVLRDGKVFEQEITLPPLPKEEFPGIITEYGSVLTERGHRVRTILTRPENARGRLPGIFLVPWMSCDPVEFPVGGMVGIDMLIHRLVTDSGFVMMRVEKPGLVDSEGPPCIEADFQTEFAGFYAGLRKFKRNKFVDPDRIFILAQSNGAGYAPLVVDDEKVAGYVVTGGWVKTWFEHMLYIERSRYGLIGLSPGEISRRMRLVAELYTDYLIRKKLPGEIIAEKPHLVEVWEWQPAHQYGRPAAYMQQLQDLNLEAAWEKVEVPVLVIYGEYDWAMSGEDHRIIAEIVNRRHPGFARFVEMPRMNHSLFFYESAQQAFDNFGSGKFDESVVTLVLDWMNGVLSQE